MAVLPLTEKKTVNGVTYEALTLRRADGGAMRLLDRSGALALMAEVEKRRAAGVTGLDLLPTGLLDKMAPFFARLAGVDEAVIDALDSRDFMALFDEIEEVMPDGPLSPAATTTA
ncbi:hypothetical protein AFEL58S_02011 [Afipia felis]